ncbi:MAG: hypothetical protein ACFE0S_10230 [Rhodospirillales bacterium]|jgi:hypothetical protein
MDTIKLISVFGDRQKKTPEIVSEAAKLIPGFKPGNSYSPRGMINNTLAVLEAVKVHERSS